MPYQRKLSSKFPSLFVFLLDQSGSMTASDAQGKVKKDQATRLVNDVVEKIIDSCVSDGIVQDRCSVAIIGYGSSVTPLKAGMVADWDKSVLRKEPVDQNGEKSMRPVWIEAAADGTTNMAGAFDAAHDLISSWLTHRNDSFPPTVINISDGAPDDKKSALDSAGTLMKLATSDGNVLLYNAFVDNTAMAPVVFPTSDSAITDENARFMYSISSVVPKELVTLGQQRGVQVSSGSRGFIFDSSIASIARLLYFGTSRLEEK